MTQRSKIRCPKCGRAPTSYREEWFVSVFFDADEAGFAALGDTDCQPRRPTGKVTAYCANCDRTWRLRGVRQITEVQRPEYPKIQTAHRAKG